MRLGVVELHLALHELDPLLLVSRVELVRNMREGNEQRGRHETLVVVVRVGKADPFEPGLGDVLLVEMALIGGLRVLLFNLFSHVYPFPIRSRRLSRQRPP